MTHQDDEDVISLQRCQIPFPQAENNLKIFSLLKSITVGEKIIFWYAEDAQKVNDALEEEILNRIEVEYFVHHALIRRGKQSYDQHIRSLKSSAAYTIYPDHTTSPRAFAYALQHHAFTQKELSFIRFDEKTHDEFVQNYGHDALQQTVLELLDVKHLRAHENWLNNSRCNHNAHCCCC